MIEMDFSEVLFDLRVTSERIREWREALSTLETVEKQQAYYDAFIFPVLNELDTVIEYRHNRHRDGREIEKLALYAPNFNDLLDKIYSVSPTYLHELVTDAVLCKILKSLTPEQKTIIYQSAVLGYTVAEIAVIKGTSERNIRKTKETALRHIRGQFLPSIMFRYKIQTNEKYRYLFLRGVSTTYWERGFAARLGAEYADYYGEMKFDFVEIIKAYRAQEQRMRDNTARIREAIRRCKERQKTEKVLQN